MDNSSTKNPTTESDILSRLIWNSADSILVRIDGKEYLLQGFNALVFTDLTDSGFLNRMFPEDQDALRTAINNLAIALATIDRQYSEPAAISTIRNLWLKEKQTGIKRFVDLLAQRQWRDSNWEGYRDHLNHMLKVYLTGLYLYKNCNALRTMLLSASGCNEDEFLRRWLYASTFHDIGYIFELPKPDKVTEDLKYIEDYVNNFLYYHDQDLTDDLMGAGLKTKTIDRKHGREILSILGLHQRDLQSVDDLGNVWGAKKNLWERLDELGEKSGIGHHGISAYYRLCLTQSPPMTSRRPAFHDHGISGAMSLLYISYAQQAIFKDLDRELKKDDSGNPIRRTGRQDVLAKMVEWAGDVDDYVLAIEQVAIAIALHNIYKDAWKVEEIPWNVDLANYWVSIHDYPLAFFLILVDILQDWDRPGFNPSRIDSKLPLRASDVDIRSDGSKVLLGYPDKPDAFAKIINDMKIVLRPNEVDLFIAPLNADQIRGGPLPLPTYVRYHNERIIQKLKGDWFEHFINLYMEIPVKVQPEYLGTHDQFTIFEIAERFAKTPIAILGVPGAGKTTLVKKLVFTYVEKGSRIPIFISMGLYAGQTDLTEMFNFSVMPSTFKGLLNDGKFLIIVDGINEVNISQRDYATRAIASLIEKYPNNQYFITCRTADYPPYLRPIFREFRVLPLSPEVVREYLEQVLGGEFGRLVYSKLPLRIRDLCRNPLLLTMLTYVYVGEQIALDIPESKAALYKLFLQKLFERDDAIRSIELTHLIHEDFLRHIANQLDNRTTVASHDDAESWINTLYGNRYQGQELSVLTVTREVLTRPPMKSSGPWRVHETEFSFMHQSFQEYYSAYNLLKGLEDGSTSLDKVAEYASPKHKHWWESLTLLVGLMSDATTVIEAIKRRAESIAYTMGDQSSMTLVSRCIREAKRVDPLEVDDVIVRTLLVFKFGKVAFDYDLFYGLNLIRPEQRSPGFPPRLIEDLNWWLDKYARVSPVDLGTETPIESLLKYLDSHDEGLIVDTLFTLHYHPARATALQPLLSKLERSTGTIREQIIVALGYLEKDAVAAVAQLVKVIDNPRESKWARAYALASLGKIGDCAAAPNMITYMLDHNNPYRDSASWSLQGLMKKNMDNSELLVKLKTVYLNALLNESNDLEGRYAKGNIVYSLGELKATEFADDIVRWIEKEHDPYVLEDGVQSIGQLGNVNALPIIVTNLSSTDPVVRMSAIDALVNIAFRQKLELDLVSYIQPMLNDKTAIVREHAQKAIQKARIS